MKLSRQISSEIPNSQWIPRRLLLIRHGESEANVHRELYGKMPDWRIPLTARGRVEALDCGRRLRKIVKNENVYIYYSPYIRARQTLAEVRKSLDPMQVQGEREDERLREQEMGNLQPLDTMDKTWEERNAYGRSYYKFPEGESSVAVGDRLSSFFDSLLRERLELTSILERNRAEDAASERGRMLGEDDDNVVIVSHGILIRLFIARWFRVPMEVFETMFNPPNCAIVVLERSHLGRLVMTDISKKLFGSDPLLEMMKFDGRDNTDLFRQMFYSSCKGSK